MSGKNPWFNAMDFSYLSETPQAFRSSLVLVLLLNTCFDIKTKAKHVYKILRIFLNLIILLLLSNQILFWIIY